MHPSAPTLKTLAQIDMELIETNSGTWKIHGWTYKHKSVQEKRAVGFIKDNAEKHLSLGNLKKALENHLSNFNDKQTISIKIVASGTYYNGGYPSGHRLLVKHKSKGSFTIAVSTRIYGWDEAKEFAETNKNAFIDVLS